MSSKPIIDDSLKAILANLVSIKNLVYEIRLLIMQIINVFNERNLRPQYRLVLLKLIELAQTISNKKRQIIQHLADVNHKMQQWFAAKRRRNHRHYSREKLILLRAKPSSFDISVLPPELVKVQSWDVLVAHEILHSLMDKDENNSLRVSSLESVASLSQVETGRFTSNTGSLVCFGESLYDCVSVMLLCPRHRTLALSTVTPEKRIWFPVHPIKSGQGYIEAVHAYLKQIFTGSSVPRFKYPQILHVMRLQIPSYFEFVTRIIYFIELISDESSQCCNCPTDPSITWHSWEAVFSLHNLWGPEPLTYLVHYQNGNVFCLTNSSETTVLELVSYINGSGSHQEMLHDCGCHEEEILALFTDYVTMCYPSQFMNAYSFQQFVARKQLLLVPNREDLSNVFRAFSFGLGFINFYDLIIGLAAMDRQTAHERRIGKIRVSYIFRYYNDSGSVNLGYPQIKKLARDLVRHRGHTIDEAGLEREVNQIYHQLGVEPRSPISEAMLTRAISSLQLRGTSILFRAAQSQSPIGQWRQNLSTPEMRVMQVMGSGSGIKMQHLKGICTRCREKQYTVAAHYVKVLQDGTIVEPQENTGLADPYRMPKATRRLSYLAFLGTNPSNQMLDGIRSFFEDPQNSSWSAKHKKSDFVDKVMKICQEAVTLIASEPRIAKVNSPVYILGDIHGNLNDLLIYERIFWRMGPSCLSANYLFLGDYVDRGAYSVECILYLLCAKILSPTRFTLLRGNHELRCIQQQFTFQRECLTKFEKHGEMVWEAFNQVFDVMPLCAVVDEQIYCAHGGIPTSLMRLEQVAAAIPCPMVEPEAQSPVAWEILWNDPITSQEYEDYISLLRTQNSTLSSSSSGFLPNTKRGTAYYFADEAVNAFLQANNLSHVIRAHEVVPSGFQFFVGGRVTTVFSSSKYCGSFNESAVALVDANKIRIIKVDTNNK